MEEKKGVGWTLKANGRWKQGEAASGVVVMVENSAAESKLPADTIKYRQQPACYTHMYTTRAANPQRLSQH